jgi:hypothetical protein
MKNLKKFILALLITDQQQECSKRKHGKRWFRTAQYLFQFVYIIIKLIEWLRD